MTSLNFKCRGCSREYGEPIIRCLSCGGVVEPDHPKEWRLKDLRGMWRYVGLLPRLEQVVSLGEGGTPLLKSASRGRVLFKDESRNPTGSFRDRSASPIISYAAARDVGEVVCASDGNHGASVAAYASRCGIRCHVVVPAFVDPGKLAQMVTYGAHLEEYGVLLDDAIDRAISLAARRGYYQATAELNPLSIPGLKTISYEIHEDAGGDVDWVVVPSGSGLTLYSIFRGFQDLVELGVADGIPRILAVQSLHSPSIVAEIEGLSAEKTRDKPVMGLNFREPLFMREAVEAVTKSGGRGILVGYNEALDAGRELARREGLFVELAAAAGYAGLLKALEHGVVGEDEKVVVLITSSGLKAVEAYSYVPRRRQLLTYRGLDMKAAILKLIELEGPRHGYEIWKLMGERTSIQAIYQHLSELEEAGLLRSERVRRRKVYYLTDKGRLFLKLLDIKE